MKITRDSRRSCVSSPPFVVVQVIGVVVEVAVCSLSRSLVKKKDHSVKYVKKGIKKTYLGAGDICTSSPLCQAPLLSSTVVVAMGAVECMVVVEVVVVIVVVGSWLGQCHGSRR